MNAVDEIVNHIRSGCQAMRLVTHEEHRALEALKKATQKVTELDKDKMQLITWDADAGFSDTDEGKPKDPVGAIRSLVNPQRFKGDVLFVFKDFHPFLKEPVIQRAFRNLRETNSLNRDKQRRPVAFLGPSDVLPMELRRSIIDVEFGLPNDEDLARLFKYVHSCVGNGKTNVDPAVERRIITAMRGMTEPEAESACFYAIQSRKGFTVDCADTIEDEKAKVLKSSGALTYIPKSAIANEEEIGGYEEFKRFIRVRAKSYIGKARDLGLSLPKGVVLLGPPGTGKTTVGKIASKILGMPLVMFDFGSVFGSLVGESEAKMRNTLQQVVSLGGAVMVVDDADKAFRNATSSAGDSGTTQRVFQQFLVWRSEYKGPVFVIMTMNSTEGIPAELLRPGRFDAVMCSLLPDAGARKEILRIHMKKRNIPDKFTEDQWDTLALLSDQFSGAELEGALDEATYIAFDARETNAPTFKELEESVSKTVPTAVRDAKTVEALISYCKTNRLRSVNGNSERLEQVRNRRSVAL